MIHYSPRIFYLQNHTRLLKFVRHWLFIVWDLQTLKNLISCRCGTILSSYGFWSRCLWMDDGRQSLFWFSFPSELIGGFLNWLDLWLSLSTRIKPQHPIGFSVPQLMIKDYYLFNFFVLFHKKFSKHSALMAVFPWLAFPCKDYWYIVNFPDIW